MFHSCHMFPGMAALIACFAVLLIVANEQSLLVMGFQIPHANHHHPVYVQYRQEQLEQYRLQTFTQSRAPSQHPTGDSGMMEEEYTITTSNDQLVNDDPLHHHPSRGQQVVLIDLDKTTTETMIATPVTYDEETGMVQTAVRAIIQHPISSMVDNQMVGLSSTLVISLGAIHELVDCIEMEWAHHATSSTEGLAILSLGHFLHYGRETIRQLVELHDIKEKDSGKEHR